MFTFTEFSNNMEDTDDDISVEVNPLSTMVSSFAPINSEGVFVKDFQIDPGPLIHETFIQRRHSVARGSPIVHPLGSQPMADLIPFPSNSARILDEDRPHSPPTIYHCDVIFDRDRDYTVGFSLPPPSQGSLRGTLEALPHIRSIWLILNAIGLNLDNPQAMSSGFVTGMDVQERSLLASIASYSMVRTFSSRLEVDEFLRDAAFSVQVEVSAFHWILVAPFFICRIIQDWAASSNASSALVRSYPDLDTAFSEISSSLDSLGRLAFLSPLRYSSLGPLETSNITNGTFQFPDLPQDLRRSRSQGCFRPTSMVILNHPYPERQESSCRGFTVLSTDWGNSSIRVDRCFGYPEMVTIVSRSRGNSLAIPFLEGPRGQDCHLTFSLMQWLPYFCWPAPLQDDGEIAQEISASFHPPIIVNRFSSQVSQGSEGSV
jgi:hypothetical protein